MPAKINRPNNYFFVSGLANALAHIYRAPMTVITAPLGYGKEIAVSRYVTTTNANTLWINIPKDAGEEYFWDALRGAFTELCGEAAAAFSCPGLSLDNGGMDEATAMIRAALAGQGGQETAIVIDNFQNIHGAEAAYRFLRHIAACTIPRFHIVLLSARRLPVSADDALNGIVWEIGKTLFRLDRQGVAQFFDSYGIKLTEEQAEDAEGFSEGWLSARSALVITALERGCFDGAVMDEARRRLTAYLRGAIWDELPEQARLFLTYTGFAEAFTAEQAKYVCLYTELRTDASLVQTELMEQQLLLDFDTANGTYRLHGLLRSLAAEEAQKLPAAVSEAVSRAFSGQNHGGADVSALTAREWEVLTLLRDGKKYREIGESLYISENTVKSLTKSIYRKLGVQSKKEL
jgi:ATP/maltotriose-dependent transcriptional regulator MalT